MNSGSMSPGATGDATGQDGGTALLEFREVNTHYGAVHILKDVNLSIYPGELVCLLGGNASGKTTTLASMINHMNDTMDHHVITLEDPIEYYHQHKKCTINQRAIGVDVPSFAEALRRALRMDPDVILVGEMRDLEPIESAIL